MCVRVRVCVCMCVCVCARACMVFMMCLRLAGQSSTVDRCTIKKRWWEEKLGAECEPEKEERTKEQETHRSIYKDVSISIYLYLFISISIFIYISIFLYTDISYSTCL